MSRMNVDTSREAVERLVAKIDDETNAGGLLRWCAPRVANDAAAVLRALLTERDAARAQLTDVLAGNDALRFVMNNMRAEIAATYRAGAEAMRDAIKVRIRAHSFDLKNSGPKTEALAAVDATPLPERKGDG